MTDKQLKAIGSCPFCGGVAEMYYPFHLMGKPNSPATYNGGVRCKECGCQACSTTPPDQAISAWNRRAAPAAPTEGARVCIGEPDYKARFETMVYMIGEITQALGISDDEAACANGNDVILNAIRELKGERDNFADDAYALAGEGARDVGVGAAIYQFQRADGFWVDQTEVSYLSNQQYAADQTRIVYARPDPLLAEAVEALEKLTDNAEQYAFEVWLRTAAPSGDAESVKRQWEESSDFRDFADEWESALAILAKVQAEKEQA